MQTEISNFWGAIGRCKNPLICFHEELETGGAPSGGDAVAASLALSEALKKHGKNPEIVSTGFKTTPYFNFLGAGDIKPSVEGLRKFVISLDVSKNKVSDFSYDIAGDKLNIYLTPKEGLFREAALETKHENFKYDLVIALDSPSLPSLGKLYSAHSELFSDMPIINIDHGAANEFYGQINLVNLAASSTAEVVAQILKQQNFQIDSGLATKLLAGMIAKTRNFRHTNLSPKTLELAARLLELGARREEIIENFYRTRSPETLRLWGRALARLKFDLPRKLVWTLLGREDFLHAGAKNDLELGDVIHELIVYSPDAKIVVLLYEQGGPLNICALIASTAGRDARELGKVFGAEGTNTLVKFCLTNLNIVEAEKYVIEKVKALL